MLRINASFYDDEFFPAEEIDLKQDAQVTPEEKMMRKEIALY